MDDMFEERRDLFYGLQQEFHALQEKYDELINRSQDADFSDKHEQFVEKSVLFQNSCHEFRTSNGAIRKYKRKG